MSCHDKNLYLFCLMHCRIICCINSKHHLNLCTFSLFVFFFVRYPFVLHRSLWILSNILRECKLQRDYPMGVFRNTKWSWFLQSRRPEECAGAPESKKNFNLTAKHHLRYFGIDILVEEHCPQCILLHSLWFLYALNKWKTCVIRKITSRSANSYILY